MVSALYSRSRCLQRRGRFLFLCSAISKIRQLVRFNKIILPFFSGTPALGERPEFFSLNGPRRYIDASRYRLPSRGPTALGLAIHDG